MNTKTFVARLKKLAMLALTAVMLVSATSIGALADDVKEGEARKLYPNDEVIFVIKNITRNLDVIYQNYDGKSIYSKSFEITATGSTKFAVILSYEDVFNQDEQEVTPDETKKFDHWAVTWENNKISLRAVAVETIDFVYVPNALPTVELSRHSATGYIGGTLELDFHGFNMLTTEVTWTSSDETVATVDSDGVVTFVGKGKATITLDVKGYGKLTCAVTVKQKGLIKR